MRFIKFWLFWVLVIGVSSGRVVEVALADRLSARNGFDSCGGIPHGN